MTDEKLLTTEEVAKMLALTKSCVQLYTRLGRIPCVKIGWYPRYRKESIERWIASKESRTKIRPWEAGKNRAWAYPSTGELPFEHKTDKLLLYVDYVNEDKHIKRFAIGTYHYGVGKFYITEPCRRKALAPEEVVAWAYIENPKGVEA